MVTARPFLCVVATIVVALNLGCASTNGAPTQADLDEAIRARTAAMGIRLERQEPLPPDVNLTDGLTQEEAVAVALWNSPSFQATLTDLGIARADLVEAGLLRNPIFSLLFPIGPKQLEFTLQYPFEVLWQRPARVERRTLNAQAIGERLVWDALSLVAQVRSAHADAITADRRLALATRERRADAAARRHYRRPLARRRYQRTRSACAEQAMRPAPMSFAARHSTIAI